MYQPLTIHFGLLGGTLSVMCLTTVATYSFNMGSLVDKPSKTKHETKMQKPYRLRRFVTLACQKRSE